ncbi:MAG: hypothetical protein ACRYHQ_08755 [Janthinobacterium lividum]
MNIDAAVTFWLSQFLAIFLQGLQSRNVNRGRYGAAAFTSVLLAGAQVALIRGLVQAPALIAFALLGTAGPSAIISAMAFHAWTERRRRKP